METNETQTANNTAQGTTQDGLSDGSIAGIAVGVPLFFIFLIVITIYLVKHIQRQRRYAAYNKAMVERGIARRSQALNATQATDLQTSLQSTESSANASHGDKKVAPMRPSQKKKTSRVSLDRTVSGVWMGEEYEGRNNTETMNIPNVVQEETNTQEIKSVRQSDESKTSFDSDEKRTADSQANQVLVSNVIPNVNESRDLSCETSKPTEEVVHPVPKKRTSILRDRTSLKKVKCREVDERELNEDQEQYADDFVLGANSASSLPCGENVVPHEVVNDEILYALPMRKPSSIKGAKVVDKKGDEEEDEYATLRVESQNTRPTSRIKSSIAGSYEDLVIGQVPDGRLNIPLNVALKSMSLPSAKKVKRMLVGDEETGDNGVAGPSDTQSMKKVPAFDALHKLIGAELKTKHSSLKERSTSTQSDNLEFATTVTEPLAMKKPGNGNSQVKKKTKFKKKHDPGYEKVDLDGPPFGVQIPRMPPGALEKLRKQSEEDEQVADTTNKESGSQDLSYVDDLHQATDDGSIYTIPMKKTPSVKSTGKTPSLESQNDTEQSPDERHPPETSRSPAPPAKIGEGVQESKDATQGPENRQSLSRKSQKSKRHFTEEEAFVELGTPGQKNPTLRESGKPPSTVIISDQDVKSTKTDKSEENGVEESAYAISNIVTKSPQSPISAVDCDDKQKPTRPPPPKITRKRSMEAKNN